METKDWDLDYWGFEIGKVGLYFIEIRDKFDSICVYLLNLLYVYKLWTGMTSQFWTCFRQLVKCKKNGRRTKWWHEMKSVLEIRPFFKTWIDFHFCISDILFDKADDTINEKKEMFSNSSSRMKSSIIKYSI